MCADHFNRLVRVVEIYKSRNSQLEHQLLERDQKINTISRDHASLLENLNGLNTQNGMLIGMLQDLQSKFLSSEEKVKSLSEMLEERRRELEHSSSENAILQKKIWKLEEECRSKEEKIQRFQSLKDEEEEAKRVQDLKFKEEEDKQQKEMRRKEEARSLKEKEEEKSAQHFKFLEEEKERSERIQAQQKEEETRRIQAMKEEEEKEIKRLQLLRKQKEDEEARRIQALKEEEEKEIKRLERLRKQKEEEEARRILEEKEQAERVELLRKKREQEEEEDRRKKFAAARVIISAIRKHLAAKKLRKFAAARVILSAMRKHLAAKKLRQLEQDLLLKKKRNEAIKEKGLYRAFCRVKPFLGGGDAPASVVHVEPANDIIRIMDPKGQKSAAYMFDSVFGPDSTQDKIFEEVGELVESALDGNNVCLMAYGQTGSGKSYTMQGTAQHPGIIPRAIEKLFDRSRVADGWTFSFKVSAIQIYNNSVEDLLVPGRTPAAVEMFAGKKDAVVIPGLVERKVSSSEELLSHFVEASGKRTTDSTTKNATSSRSHFVFHVDILGKRSGADTARGRLVFVDLAGSEAKNVAQGDKQADEGTNIRRSLAALKTYLMQASKGNRADSRSERIVQKLNDVLHQKDAKLLVIATISADLQSFSQSKEALEFLAVISKLKKYEQNSNAYEAAKRACANHDRAIGSKSKPWRGNKAKSGSQKPKEDIFFFDQSMDE
jgi:kinesin family protein C1